MRRTTVKGCNGHIAAVHDVNAFYPWDEREHGWGKVLEKKGFSPDVFMGSANDEPTFDYPTLAGEVDEAFRDGCGPFTLGVSEFDLFGGRVYYEVGMGVVNEHVSFGGLGIQEVGIVLSEFG